MLQTAGVRGRSGIRLTGCGTNSRKHWVKRREKDCEIVLTYKISSCSLLLSTPTSSTLRRRRKEQPRQEAGGGKEGKRERERGKRKEGRKERRGASGAERSIQYIQYIQYAVHTYIHTDRRTYSTLHSSVISGRQKLSFSRTAPTSFLPNPNNPNPRRPDDRPTDASFLGHLFSLPLLAISG